MRARRPPTASALPKWFEEPDVRIDLRSATSWLAIVGFMLLGGCTTYVADVKKDERYTKRLTDTSIVWTSSPNLMTRITRTAQYVTPVISEKDKAQSRKNITDLQTLFSRELPGLLAAGLQKSAVIARPTDGGAATRLSITPTHAETECVPAGCKDSLWLQVQLFDLQERKTVWTGRFKVGAPTVFNTNDVAVVQSYAGTLISQLKLADLL
jgi:hypothetical protein